MRTLGLVLLLVATLLSGCVGEGDRPSATSEPVGGQVEDETDGASEAVAITNPHHGGPLYEVEPLHWNGTLGTFAFACEYQTTGECQGHVVTTGDNDVFIEGPFLLAAADITLTWTASNLFVEELHFEIMTMGTDAGAVELESVVGRSPLHIQLDGLDLNLTENDSIHIFAYNPKGLQHHPPFIVHASVDQAVSVSGSLTRAEVEAMAADVVG